MLNMEALLAELENDPPCGPDLEYDPLFKELERMASGKNEQQLGDIIIPAEEPDWADVKQRALALFSRTKDLRIAVLLTRALVRMEHTAGLRDGLTLIHAMLERYWETVHPRFDADGEQDPTTRLNVLAPLADKNALLLDVRNALIVPAGALGRIAIRDILIALGKLQAPAGEVLRTQAQIAAAIAAAAIQDRSAIDATRASIDHANAIYSLLVDKVGRELAIDLRPLSNMLTCVVQACDDALGVITKGGSEAVAEVGSASALNSSGEIRNREDAMRQLDTICSFFDRTEPGNPAPLLIRRAQRLMNKSFVEIIQDLAPDSLSQIRNIAGLKDT